jgi:hypothetical protein
LPAAHPVLTYGTVRSGPGARRRLASGAFLNRLQLPNTQTGSGLAERNAGPIFRPEAAKHC